MSDVGSLSPVRLETGPYILRSLIQNVALSASGDDTEVRITCVEVCKENLYIGTSLGEILHHVQIPPDPRDPASQAQWILASRLQPPVNQHNGLGIQQILLLPAVSKACVLSNNTLNFYTLPELSPAFPQLKPLTCGWVGGVDLNDDQEERDAVAIMMCLRNKIRIVNIGETAQKERDIEFGGCLATVRRDGIACVADARSYALVDVVAQQKIPLLSISSLDEQSPDLAGEGTLQDETWPATAGEAGGVSRSSSVAGKLPERLKVQERGHMRSTSLGVVRAESAYSHRSRSSVGERHRFDVPPGFRPQISPRPSTAVESTASEVLLSKPLPAPPTEAGAGQASRETSPNKSFVPLRPIITSPNENEFLLVTGTAPDEPGVGMFVNLDGEVTRGSMEFASFPESMLTDGRGIDLSVSASQLDIDNQEEGYVLAVVNRNGGKDVQIQRWDVDPGEYSANKDWLGVASQTHGLNLPSDALSSLGIRRITDRIGFNLAEVTSKLAPKAIRLVPSSAEVDDGKLAAREREEVAYYSRMSQTRTSIVLWAGAEIHWTMRNPLVLQLDARLRLAQSTSIDVDALVAPQRPLIESLINDLRGLKSSTELEFYTLSYIRQKAAVLLFMDLVLQTMTGTIAFERDVRAVEEALLESEIDPRFVICFLPGIKEELQQAAEGVWVQGGIKDLIDRFLHQYDPDTMPTDVKGPFGDNLLSFAKRFLMVWRMKKGNPSVIDGEHVFPSVEAALLRILLIIDRQSAPGPATAGSVRAELNAMVDSGLDCFDRAVQLLEGHQRLYILSRLYQSRKNAAKVLATWRRIIEGEKDQGGEFVDGEQELKTYLTKLRNRKLVEEYGTWLAHRNPKLGVQVFADGGNRTSWSPAEALAILRSRAPGAVKEYLEYLVFARKQSQHINELIAYYLDLVVSELASNARSRAILADTYETYRALRPPKPTYRQFIEENALDAEWWRSRLRLLQLLGASAGDSDGYDVRTVLDRLAPFEKQLVPEMVILNGRRARHEEAIRLLTHGLADFDMAISYCLRGGGSLYDSLSSISITRSRQSELFKTLLQEFLRIRDITDRIERTGELLERFGAWFEIEYVLAIMPQGWSVQIFKPFLVGALKGLVRDRNESRIVRALRGAENLAVATEKIDRVEELGPVVEGVVSR